MPEYATSSDTELCRILASIEGNSLDRYMFGAVLERYRDDRLKEMVFGEREMPAPSHEFVEGLFTSMRSTGEYSKWLYDELGCASKFRELDVISPQELARMREAERRRSEE